MVRVRPNLVACVPAGFLVLAAAGAWVPMGGAATPGQLAGWLMLILLLITVVGIASAAAMRRPGLALACLTGAAAVLVAVGGMRTLGLGAVVALACLAAVWTMVWSAMARLLLPLGPGVSTIVPLTLSGLCLASPVAAMPLVHAAAHWGAAGAPLVWQERVVEVVRHACPFLAVLDVMPEGVRSNWATLPGMYRWSGLGQEVPMLLPHIWVCAGIYAAVAGVLLGTCLWRQRQRE